MVDHPVITTDTSTIIAVIMATVIGRRTGFRRTGRTEMGRRHDRCVPVITTDTSTIIAIIIATVIGRRNKLCYAYNSVGGLKLFCLKGFEKIVHRDPSRNHPFRSLFAQGGNRLILEETILLVSRGILITAQCG